MIRSVALVMVGIFLINVPFGWWRDSVRKFSPRWFLAVHLPVPFAIAMRWSVGLGFRWSLLPLFIAAYFGGQTAGARWRRSRATA